MFTKKLCVILSLSFVFLSLSACADKTPTVSSTTVQPSHEVSETAETTTAEEEKIQPELSDADLGGYEFNFLIRSADDVAWQSHDIVASEENGEPINDAVYRRNKYVEEKYNFKIKGTDFDGDIAGLKASITAGDASYDAVMLKGRDQATLAMAGLLTDFYDIPNINLDKPWWDKAAEEQLSVGGRLFFTDGDISITSKNGLRILMFNKKMIQDYGLDNPYELVKSNTWTMDKLNSMCKEVSFDENGDGIFDENDRYGYLVQDNTTINMYYATGEKIVSKDENDIPHLSVNTPRSLQVLDMISTILSNKNAVMFSDDYADLGTEKALQAVFEDNRGLFFAEVLDLAKRMRSSDVDFGIIPVPKFDANQENYNTYVDYWCMAPISVPITNTELDKTGIILESMAAEAKYTLTPAYYDICLQGKFIRDDESAEMLDIIFKNKVICLDELYSWGMSDAIVGLLKAKNCTFSSTIEKKSDAVEKKILKTIDAFNSFE